MNHTFSASYFPVLSSMEAHVPCMGENACVAPYTIYTYAPDCAALNMWDSVVIYHLKTK